MSKKLLIANNVFMNVIPTCPCCGSLEEECICTTLEELGATDLELDFAIAMKTVGKTFSGGTSYRADGGYTWYSINDTKFTSDEMVSFNTKMAELGRKKYSEGTDYYTYYASSGFFLYWNGTLYGKPNITRLNKLLTFTDEQLGHLNIFEKCVIPCGFCGGTHKEDNCPYINTYVFNVVKNNAYKEGIYKTQNRKITFPSGALRGDTSSTVITDWGDGTVNTSLNHTYSSDGVYTVKTKHCPSNNGNISVTESTNIPQFLQEVKSLNKNITDVKGMFYDCDEVLTTFNVPNFDTSNITTMYYMFRNCNKLTTVNMSNWNTSNVTSMEGVFHSCANLTSLDVSNWNTSNVTRMYAMFQSCNNLTSLDLSNFNTSNVINMGYMFANCNKLTTLDLSNFDTSKVTDMSGMFSNCGALTDFKAPQNISTSIDFSPCTNLTHDSLMSIINNLATVSSKKTLTLGSKNKAKLTDDEIAIATAKNWTVK